jgi:hypothetical protein
MQRFFMLMLCLWIAGCSAALPTGSTAARPGCDRNGDEEERRAC